MKRLLYWLMLCALLAGVLAGCAPPAPEVIEKEVEVTRVVEVEKEVEVPASVQEWEVVNPAGARAIEIMELVPRLTTLEGKTVILRWNNKPNGDLFLDRVAELLEEQVKDINIIKLYEVDPTTMFTGGGFGQEQELAQKVLTYNPDIVIASQGD
jgi:hypothetical protein